MFNPYEDTLNSPFIIAEIGINHNGNLNLAKKLIDLACEAGCQAVKFQKRDIHVVYTKEYLNSSRQSPWGTTQLDQKSGLEFDEDQYDCIDEYCKSKNILWCASAWDINSQNFLRKYDCKFNKVASAMLTHKDFLGMDIEKVIHPESLGEMISLLKRREMGEDSPAPLPIVLKTETGEMQTFSISIFPVNDPSGSSLILATSGGMKSRSPDSRD